MSHNTPNIMIEADDRERNSAVIPLLERMEGAEVTIVRLEAGDYRIDGRLLFERKTMPDFALSIVDGRFFRQMMHLAAPACRGVLILEGTFDDLADSGMRREALQGALITAGVILGVPVLYARDAAETAALMMTAARQVRWSVRGAVQRPGYRPAGKRKRQLYLLQGLPGIGPERAQRLLRVFGSVEAVFSAPCEELAAVAGIGAKTAGNIRWAVSEGQGAWGGKYGAVSGKRAACR